MQQETKMKRHLTLHVGNCGPIHSICNAEKITLNQNNVLEDQKTQTLNSEKKDVDEIPVKKNVQNLVFAEVCNMAQNNVDRPSVIIKSVLERVKEDVSRRIEVDVTTPFKSLDIPKQKENPVLRSVDFYRGKEKSKIHGPHDYRNRQLDKNQEVSLNKLHESKNGRSRHVMLVSSVGMGKSTLVKRYCKMVFDGKVELLRNIQCILLLEFQNIRKSSRITPESLLLNHLTIPDENEKHQLFLWMKGNPSRVLIVIDGLDQAQFSISHDSKIEDIGYDSRTSSENIILNLFKGKLFKECYLLTSSREYAAIHIPYGARPNCVSTLQGLQGEAVERLVKAFAGEDGEHVWKVLSTKSRSLLAMCETPLFLIMATAVYKENIENPPKTLSGVMMHVLLTFIHSSHSFESSPVDILKKLMLLAFHGIQSSQFTFSAQDFAEVGLELGKVKDLIIMTPRRTKKILNQKLLESDILMYFCHLSFQEAIAALYIAYMEFRDFEKFTKKHWYRTQWAVVKHMVCGLLLNKETFDVMKEILNCEEPTDLIRKKNKLKVSIEHEHLKSGSPGSQTRPSLFMTLQECGDDVNDIREQVNDVRIVYKRLGRSDMYNIMCVVQHRPVINYMGLTCCSLNASNLCIFEQAMAEKSTKIKRIEIPFNRELCEQSCKMFGKIISYCGVEDISMQNCNLTVECLRGFKDSLLDMEGKLPVLDLRKNAFGPDHLREIIAFLPKISREIWVQEDDFSKKAEDVASLEFEVSKIPGLALVRTEEENLSPVTVV